MVSRREDRIRQRAYELWEREGRPPGREAEHWQQATEEIDREGDLDLQDEPQEPGAEAAVAMPPAGQSSTLRPGEATPGGEGAATGAPRRPQRPTGAETRRETLPEPKAPGTAGAAGKGAPATNRRRNS